MHRADRSSRIPVAARCPMETWLLARPGSARRPNWRRQPEIAWGKSELLFAFGDCSAVELLSELYVEQAQAAVARAMATWNSIGLPIALTLSDGEADVVVQWHHSKDDPELALVPGVQAHADYPPGNSIFGGPPLPIHFSADYLWGIEQPGCFDVETIALHELGHVLGLVWHTGPESIMYEALGPAPGYVRHELDAATVQRARRLYQSL